MSIRKHGAVLGVLLAGTTVLSGIADAGAPPVRADRVTSAASTPVRAADVGPIQPRLSVAPERGERIALESAIETWAATASWYGARFAGNRTASGDTFDPRDLTAAHRHLPFGTRLRVTNPATERWVEVVINDRGPYVPGRDIDLSRAAAEAIGLVGSGHGRVVLERLG